LLKARCGYLQAIVLRIQRINHHRDTESTENRNRELGGFQRR
jgi:hypothetical protein